MVKGSDHFQNFIIFATEGIENTEVIDSYKKGMPFIYDFSVISVTSVAKRKMEKEWVFEDIEVESYAGYKGEESPRAFVHLARRYEILEILDRWYEGGVDPKALRQDYFRVKSKEGEIFLLRYTPRYQSWTLCRRLPAPRFSNN